MAIEVLDPERAALLTDGLSPYAESDRTIDDNGNITETRESAYAQVVNGRFTHGTRTEALKVFCPTNYYTPEPGYNPVPQMEYYMRYPRVYMVQFSYDGGRTWRNYMRVTPHNPGPPRPDTTGMSWTDAMTALRAWAAARIAAGVPTVPSPQLNPRWFLPAAGSTRARILDITPA